MGVRQQRAEAILRRNLCCAATRSGFGRMGWGGRIVGKYVELRKK